MLHTCSLSSFLFKLDCIISKFEATTECSDFSFVKLCYIKHLNETKTANGLNETQINSLTAGGAYGTAAIQGFLGYRCKQSNFQLTRGALLHP